MQIVMILLVVVSILSMLSGISVIAGANKKERIKAIWFLLIAVGAAIWSISVGIFLSLSRGNEEIIWNWAQVIFISSILTMIALVGNTSWRYKIGKFAVVAITIIGIILSTSILYSPNMVFSAIELKNTGNIATFNIGLCSIIYGALISGSMLIAFISLIYQIMHTRKRDVRGGCMVYLVGIAITSICSLICDLILPMSGYCALMWVGPVTVATTMLGYYYAILRYRLIVLSSSWMKILSYVILVTSGTVVYMIVFCLVFMALFRGSKPSIEVILLNFIMTLFILLLMPAINGTSAFVRSLIPTSQINIGYIIERLNQMASSKNITPLDLSKFLEESVHSSCIGLIIDNKLYASENLILSADEIMQISKLKSIKSGGIWQDFDKSVSKITAEHNIAAIAELHDTKGQIFGQMIIGKPVGKSHFEQKDLMQLEAIINFTAVTLSLKTSSR